MWGLLDVNFRIKCVTVFKGGKIVMSLLIESSCFRRGRKEWQKWYEYIGVNSNPYMIAFHRSQCLEESKALNMAFSLFSFSTWNMHCANSNLNLKWRQYEAMYMLSERMMTLITKYESLIVTWFVNLHANCESKKANYGRFWTILGQTWANHEFKRRIS